jgi:DNA-binding CsgD family transcriptional regulator
MDAGDVSLCVHVMKAGAADVLTKPVGTAPLLEAVRLALNRSEDTLRREVELNEVRERYASLSRREREVMALVVSGLLNKRVAHELGISEITVKAHRGRAMGKMNAKSLADLVKMAIMLQLTQCQLALSDPHRSARHARLRAAAARAPVPDSRYAPKQVELRAEAAEGKPDPST